MKFPSIYYLRERALQSAQRFPMTIATAVVGVCIALWLTEMEDVIANFFPYINSMLCAALGIPLYFSIKMFAERKQWEEKYLWLARLAGVVILLLLYWSLPDSEVTANKALPYIRYTIYNIVIHLLVSFVPFIEKGKINGFWQYNKVLFLRILASILYSGVLYVGLVIAIWSLKALFDIDIDEKWFLRLFIVMAGIFNTWFFLSGIPKNISELENDEDYPKGLKIFAQYVLISLLVVYLVILYAYSAKILLTWDWPRGIVTYLIIAMAVVGILALLLIYPYAKKEENRWITTFSKTFYFLLIPLLVVLFLAIGIRISDYGVTINRYIIVVLGVWLSFIAMSFVIGKATIKTVPISLGLLGMIVSFGPWGMFSVSERSQLSRLEYILSSNEIFNGQKIKSEVQWLPDTAYTYKYDFGGKEDQNDHLLSDSLHNEVKSILDYLNNHHGLSGIKPWFDQDMDKAMAQLEKSNGSNVRYINEANIYMEKMGLDYRHIYGVEGENKYFSLYQDYNVNTYNVLGFRYMVEIHNGYPDYDFTIDSTNYTVNLDTIIIKITDQDNSPMAAFDCSKFAKYSNDSSRDLSQEALTLYDEKSRMKLILKNISLKVIDNKPEVTSFGGVLMVE